jgi:hypothetical protein
VAFYDWDKVEPIQTISLSLRHTYIPKTTVDFAGSSSFGGRDDELVICAGKGKPQYGLSLARCAEGDFELGTFIYGIVNRRPTSTTSVRQH